MKEKIYDALSNIVDPEVGFDIVSLGLIYDASCDENGKAKVTMTLSTKSCQIGKAACRKRVCPYV